MSVKGFKFDGTVHKYEYGALQDIPQNLAQPYSTSATYAVGDYCTYNNVLHKCTTSISTAESWTAAHWSEVKLTDDVSDLKSANSLHDDEIDNTVQTITFASDGSVQKIEHKRNNVIIRTDTFTFATNIITEVRTLNTGESLTIATNLTTLETTVTYAAA